MTTAEKARELCKLYKTNREFLFLYFLAMGEWKEEEMIKKVCDWLENNASKYVYRVLDEYDMQYYAFINRREMIDNLKSYLKEQA